MGLSLWGEEILTEKAASFPICLVYRWNFPHRCRTKYFATLKFDYRIIWIMDDLHIYMYSSMKYVVLKSNEHERTYNGTILLSCPM